MFLILVRRLVFLFFQKRFNCEKTPLALPILLFTASLHPPNSHPISQNFQKYHSFCLHFHLGYSNYRYYHLFLFLTLTTFSRHRTNHFNVLAFEDSGTLSVMNLRVKNWYKHPLPFLNHTVLLLKISKACLSLESIIILSDLLPTKTKLMLLWLVYHTTSDKPIRPKALLVLILLVLSRALLDKKEIFLHFQIMTNFFIVSYIISFN